MSDQNHRLGRLQLGVLRALWREGEASTAQVHAMLRRDRDLAYNTVATILTRLARRGIVTSRREGRELVYRADVSEAQVRRSMIGRLVDDLFGGDRRALVSHLVHSEDMNDDDLDALRGILNRKEESDDS